MTFPARHLTAMLRRIGIDLAHGSGNTKCLVDLPSTDVSRGAVGRTKSRHVKITVEYGTIPAVAIGDLLHVGIVNFKVRHVAAFADQAIVELLCEASQDLVVMPGGAVVIPGA
jgi:hypothetical protein